MCIQNNTEKHQRTLSISTGVFSEAQEVEQDGIQWTKNLQVGLLRSVVLANPVQHYACLSCLVHFPYNK